MTMEPYASYSKAHRMMGKRGHLLLTDCINVKKLTDQSKESKATLTSLFFDSISFFLT